MGPHSQKCLNRLYQKYHPRASIDGPGKKAADLTIDCIPISSHRPSLRRLPRPLQIEKRRNVVAFAVKGIGGRLLRSVACRSLWSPGRSSQIASTPRSVSSGSGGRRPVSVRWRLAAPASHERAAARFLQMLHARSQYGIVRWRERQLVNHHQRQRIAGDVNPSQKLCEPINTALPRVRNRRSSSPLGPLFCVSTGNQIALAQQAWQTLPHTASARRLVKSKNARPPDSVTNSSASSITATGVAPANLAAGCAAHKCGLRWRSQTAGQLCERAASSPS